MKFFLPIIALLAIFPVQTYGAIYLGVFYNLALKSTLRSQFYSTDVLGTADDSSRVPAYDHTTIYFDPPQSALTNQYNARFGATQKAHILGYAMDEHAQALLVSYDGPNAIQSQNTFPHVTISSSNTGVYSAVYSNDLWTRIAASGYVTITNDAYGKPATITWNLKNPAIKPNLIVDNTYQFTLPSYNNYASTLVRVQLYQPSIGGLLSGTFCASSQWNGQTGKCDTTPIGPVAECKKVCNMACIKGTECRQDTDGCIKCLPIQATPKPTCSPNLCNSVECEFGCDLDPVTCISTCKEPSTGETVRTVSFQLQYNKGATKDVDTIIRLANAMRGVADDAGIPRSDYIINNKDIRRVTGQVNTRTGKWSLKLGFRAINIPDGDERKIFIEQLKKSFKNAVDSVTLNGADSILSGLVIDDADEIIEANEFYQTQTCEDGRELSAEKQCAAGTSAATTSSSSLPIATIVAPIIGGIVLIALIATAIIIRQRRINTIKAMKGIERNTAGMELNAAVTVTEVDRV